MKNTPFKVYNKLNSNRYELHLFLLFTPYNKDQTFN